MSTKNDELIEEIKKVNALLEKEKKAVTTLFNNQRDLLKKANIAGSDVAKWKHMAIRLEEENERLKHEVNAYEKQR